LGKPKIKSIEISTQGIVGIGRGYTSPSTCYTLITQAMNGFSHVRPKKISCKVSVSLPLALELQSRTDVLLDFIQQGKGQLRTVHLGGLLYAVTLVGICGDHIRLPAQSLC